MALEGDRGLLAADRTMPMLHARVKRWENIITGINHMMSRVGQGQAWIECLSPDDRKELGY